VSPSEVAYSAMIFSLVAVSIDTTLLLISESVRRANPGT
jgi:hypothetical protein